MLRQDLNLVHEHCLAQQVTQEAHTDLVQEYLVFLGQVLAELDNLKQELLKASLDQRLLIAICARVLVQVDQQTDQVDRR